ncbi:MAG: hypothetical protein CL429_05675 [Acidimicrobiaceae bacterium]|nr:hypothetical protein [Acidimicrobiaceae bacterium]|tara:strand:- start:479 stop:2008 length:1530 start_codon:yes stop_codon:yes gene_type:complete
MARGLGGFAEGFKGGFGLVNDFYAQKAKERDAEQTQEFRQEELGVRREGQKQAAEAAADLRQIRADERDARRTELEESRKWRQDQKKLETEEKIARRAAQAQTDLVNEGRLKNLELDRKIKLKQLVEIEKERENKEIENLNVRNGQHFNNLTLLADADDYSAMQEYLNLNKEDLFDDRSQLRLSDNFNPETNENYAALHQTIKQIASGDASVKPSQEALAAMTTILGQHKKKYIGQNLDENFINAPKVFIEKGYQIIGSGVSDARTSADGNLAFESYVEVIGEDGNSRFYPAAVTREGSIGEFTNQEIPLGEGIQVLAGMTTLSRHMQENPLVKQAVEQHLKIQKFGSPDKFEQEVSERLDKVYEMTKEMAQDGDMPDELKAKGFTGTVAQATANRNDVRRKIEKNILYGVPQADKGRRAEKFFQEVRDSVPKFTYEDNLTQKNRLGRTRRQGSFLDLVKPPEEGKQPLSLTQMIDINELTPDSGVLKGESLQRVIDYLDSQDKLREGF